MRLRGVVVVVQRSPGVRLGGCEPLPLVDQPLELGPRRLQLLGVDQSDAIQNRLAGRIKVDVRPEDLPRRVLAAQAKAMAHEDHQRGVQGALARGSEKGVTLVGSTCR